MTPDFSRKSTSWSAKLGRAMGSRALRAPCRPSSNTVGLRRWPTPACAKSKWDHSSLPNFFLKWPTLPKWCRKRGRIPGLTVLALAPNLKGAERGIAAGVHKLSFPVSASRQHSRSNIRMTPEQAIEQVAQTCELCKILPGDSPPSVEVGISTAFGCSLEGAISEDWVMQMAAALVKAGAASVGLSDTAGCANPVQVRRMFTRLRREIGGHAGAAHFHNTRGQGLANVVAAIDAGVTTFDASQGGLGGCPYAPGATGNIVTEDLVFLLESMGLRTGIDLDRLIAARAIILEGLPDEPLFGHVPSAGVPKGFVCASAGRNE